MTPPGTPSAYDATIIVSLRNAGDSAETVARRLLDAVTRLHVEAVVVDDGSTDGTGDALAAGLGDAEAVTLIRHESSAGVAARRNEAVAVARGEFIWFVDHDDEWDADGLAALLARSEGVDFVQARAEFAWGDGEADRRLVDGVKRFEAPTVVTAEDAARMLIDGEIHGFLWSKLIRRSTLGVDPFPIQVSQSDVVGVAVAIAAARSARIVPDVVYTYIRHPGSITRSRTPSVEALKSAHDGVLAQVGASASSDARDAFTARFLCLAAVNTAVRWGVDRSTMRTTTNAASRWARPLSLRGIRTRSTALAGSMLVLRVAPPLLPVALRLGQRGMDATRAVRSRISRTDRTVSR